MSLLIIWRLMTEQGVPPTHSVGFLLSDTARLLRMSFDERARTLGLTRAQWRVLARLAYSEGARQTTLAELLEVEPITLSRHLDRMEEAGFVERRPDPQDRRARCLYLTDKARPVLERMRALGREVQAEALAGLGDEAERQIIELLEGMRANLTARAARQRGAS